MTTELVLILVIVWVLCLTVRSFNTNMDVKHNKAMTDTKIEFIKKMINIQEKHNHGHKLFEDVEE